MFVNDDSWMFVYVIPMPRCINHVNGIYTLRLVEWWRMIRRHAGDVYANFEAITVRHDNDETYAPR